MPLVIHQRCPEVYTPAQKSSAHLSANVDGRRWCPDCALPEGLIPNAALALKRHAEHTAALAGEKVRRTR